MTTVCGFTSRALFSLVERFVTSAAAFCFVFVKMVAAATQCAASCAAAFVASLALVDCQILTLSGILVFVFSVCAGFCWAIARVSRRRSLEPCASGDVLGLRLLGSCDIALMSQDCVNEDAQASDEALAAAFKSGFVFVRRFLHVFDELCSFVGELLLSAYSAAELFLVWLSTTLSPRRGPRDAWEAQATPRLDVAEVPECVTARFANARRPPRESNFPGRP